jgi:hypothetical protein
MKAVDKGLELISYAAGGIGLAQNSTPAQSLKGMNRAANLGLINQQRIAAEQRRHNQEMIGLQEAQLDVYTEGFSQMADGLGDISFELSNQSKLMNYQSHLIEAGLNEVSNQVKSSGEKIELTIAETGDKTVKAIENNTEAIEAATKTFKEVGRELSEKLEITNKLLTDLVWTQKNKYLVESMETENEGERFLKQFQIDKNEKTQQEAFNSFQKSQSQDRFNVSSGLYLNNMEIQMGKEDWLVNFRDLFSKVSAELISDDLNRRSIAENVAQKMSLSHSIVLFEAGEYEDFLKFYNFSQKYTNEDFHIYLDAFKTVSLYATTDKVKKGDEYFVKSANKWGLDVFSKVLKRQNLTWLQMDPIRNYLIMYKQYIKDRFKTLNDKGKALEIDAFEKLLNSLQKKT